MCVFRGGREKEERKGREVEESVRVKEKVRCMVTKIRESMFKIGLY